jgi:hypothetical protein
VTEKLKKIKFLLKILRRFSTLPAIWGDVSAKPGERNAERPVFSQQMERRFFILILPWKMNANMREKSTGHLPWESLSKKTSTMR